MGSSVYGAIDPNVSEYGLCDQPPVSPWFALALLPTLSIALSLSYGSSRKQYISQCVAAAIAFCLSFFLGKVIPDGQIVGSIAAFVVGLYSNFALKVTGEPPLAPLCVGLTLLVPGSIGTFCPFQYIINSSFIYRCPWSLFRTSQNRHRSHRIPSSNALYRPWTLRRPLCFGHDRVSIRQKALHVHFTIVY